jgi:hypothetical protein
MIPIKFLRFKESLRKGEGDGGARPVLKLDQISARLEPCLVWIGKKPEEE